MDCNARSWTARLLLTCLLILVLVGCGYDNEEATTTSTTTAESTASSTQSTATEPTITINYRCGDDDTGSSDIPNDDLEEIDDIVNTIDLCENP